MAKLNRPPGGFMTQLSGVTAAVKYKRNALARGQEAFVFIELAVRHAEGTGDVSFVILGPFGSGIEDHHRGFGFQESFDHTGLDRVVVAGGAFPFGKTVFIYFDIGVTEFFRLPGGFMAQLSGGALAIEDQQGFLVLRQAAHHFIKLAVRDADGRWNVTLVVLGTPGT